MHDCSLEFKSQIENAVILINLQSHFLFSNHDHLTFSVNGFILSQCFFFLGIIPFNSTLQNHTCNLRLFSEVISSPRFSWFPVWPAHYYYYCHNHLVQTIPFVSTNITLFFFFLVCFLRSTDTVLYCSDMWLPFLTLSYRLLGTVLFIYQLKYNAFCTAYLLNFIS